MRVHLSHVRHCRARKCQEVVRHLQQHLGHDRQLVLQQQIVVAVDAAADRVLDRQDAVRGFAVVDGGKHVLEVGARNCLRVRAEPQRRRFAVRPRFALIRNAHNTASSFELPASSYELAAKKKATIRPADDGLDSRSARLRTQPYLIRSEWTGIITVPVTVTTTVKALRRRSNLMIWRYCGGRGYIMSNEF